MDGATLATEQPYGVEIHIADEVFVKQMLIPTAGTLVPQHSHEYDHVSMLAVGAVRVWRDDVLLGDKAAPCGIVIPARTKHRFLSLVDGTVIYCIHRDRTGEIDVHEEHQLMTGAI